MKFAELLTSDRIVLKRPTPTFTLAQEILIGINESRDNLRQWLPWVDNTTTVEHEYNTLYDYADKRWNDNSGFFYIICDKETGKFLGCIDLITFNEKNKNCEIGYWIRNSAQGKGYMSEALKCLEKELFTVGIHRIQIGNDPRNIRSVNVTKRADYHLDGVLKHNRWDNYHNDYADTNVWSKLNPEIK